MTPLLTSGGLTVVVVMVLVGLVPTTLSTFPFGTSTTPPPPLAMTCEVVFGGESHVLFSGNTETYIDTVSKTCKAYYCFPGGVAALMSSATCGPGQCVDPESVNTNTCVCVDCPSGSGSQADPCETNPCQNGGTCQGTLGTTTFTCNCAPGYYGSTCNLNYCTSPSNPCKNGGTCTGDSTRQTGYRCTCPPGYTDINCETPKCGSQPPPCYYGTCGMNATDPKGYTCSCVGGYSGPHCDIPGDSTCTNQNPNIDQCAHWALIGECQINAPYMHVHCQMSCKQCTACYRNCGPNGACVPDPSQPYGTRCHCLNGYSGQNCDECKDSNALCTSASWLSTCASNYHYMTTNCPKACGKCQ